MLVRRDRFGMRMALLPGLLDVRTSVHFKKQSKWSIAERHVGLPTKKESERRPRSLATERGRLENFVGEEASEARVGPRNRRSR